jgi:hypothetical protein
MYLNNQMVLVVNYNKVVNDKIWYGKMNNLLGKDPSEMKGFLMYLYVMKSNLNEQVDRIKSMMGLIMEQGVKIVSIKGTVPITSGKDDKGNIIDTTDWDTVHGILGSKRIDDDLEKRVGDELTNGSYRVTKITVTSKKSGTNVITNGSVELTSVNTNPHKFFTTRGSIGNDHINRHDNQVNGLDGRLVKAYGGKVTTFGPYEINVIGTNVNYKQSFFAVEGQSSQGQQQSSSGISINETKPATKKSLDELYKFNRNEFKTKPGKYSLTNFNITRTGTNITYTLNATPDQNGYPMLAMIIGDEAFNYVAGQNPNSELTNLSEKMINVYNEDTKQYQDYKVIITGIRDK